MGRTEVEKVEGCFRWVLFVVDERGRLVAAATYPSETEARAAADCYVLLAAFKCSDGGMYVVKEVCI